jgi:hypothetical protein
MTLRSKQGFSPASLLSGRHGRSREPPAATHLRAPPPPSPPLERPPDVRAAARKAATRPHLSLLLLPPPSRLSRMVFLILGAGSRPRPASSGSALGVAGSAPWGSGSAPWGLGVQASAAGGGGGAWLAALAGCGAGAWRRLSWLAEPPCPGRAASVWLRAGAQGLPVRLQEEDGPIPGAHSPLNPSSRDRIRCLHGRIRFSLTGSSRLEGGSTTPKSGSS